MIWSQIKLRMAIRQWKRRARWLDSDDRLFDGNFYNLVNMELYRLRIFRHIKRLERL